MPSCFRSNVTNVQVSDSQLIILACFVQTSCSGAWPWQVLQQKPHGPETSGKVGSCHVRQPSIFLRGACSIQDKDGNSKNIDLHRQDFDGTSHHVQYRVQNVPGASVEHNKFCVSVHFRNCPPESYDDVVTAVKDTLHDHPNLKASRGRKVLEIQPQVSLCLVCISCLCMPGVRC